MPIEPHISLINVNLERMVETEKNELVEGMASLFRRLHKISPMASKILATLVLEGYPEGLTFEQLVTSFQASKSTISSNLNTLLALELIYYETKEGKRRKYFKSFPFTKRFTDFLDNVQYEKDFTNRFLQYMETAPPPEEPEEWSKKIQNLQMLLSYLSEIENLTTRFLYQMNTLNS